MVVKIESRSFSTAEIQQFNTDNRKSDYNWRILMISMWCTGINYYNLAVEKDRDSVFTTVATIWTPGLNVSVSVTTGRVVINFIN